MTSKRYIKEIVERSCLPRDERKKIKMDLENEISAALERGESIEQVVERMGDPDEVAAGLFENFIDVPARPFREYKSKHTFLGLPLVHIISGNHMAAVPYARAFGARGINIGGRYSHFPYRYALPVARGIFALGPRAEGIVAIGNLSTGIISVGNLSAGIISIGNLCAGLFSIGNIALAGLIALGNAAIGALSAGNLALGYAAAGNLALGNFAVGNEVAGTFTFPISDLPAQLEQVKAFFAGLDAPKPVKAFWGIVERVFELWNDPSSAIPLTIVASAILFAIILAFVIIPHKLLKQSE